MPELHRQSRDCPGMATQPWGPLWQSIPERRSYTGSPGIVPGWLPNPGDPSGRVSQNAGVTPAVPGLSRDGYPTLGTPLAEYPRTPELHQQSQDCPGMTTQPWGPLWQSIPECRSYTGSPGIVPGWLPNPGDPLVRVSQNTGVTPAVLGLSWDLSARVSQNAGVTPAVPGLSRDGYPTLGTPLSEYPRTPELHQQSWDCPGTCLPEYPRTPELHRQSRDCPGMTEELGSHPGTILGLPV